MVGRKRDEKSDLKVAEASLEVARGAGDGVFGFLLAEFPDGTRPNNGDSRIRMVLENGEVEYLPFWSDEVTISPSDVLGKTLNEAWDVFFRKDLAYIRGE